MNLSSPFLCVIKFIKKDSSAEKKKRVKIFYVGLIVFCKKYF